MAIKKPDLIKKPRRINFVKMEEERVSWYCRSKILRWL